jgi:Predicted transcriptional regulators
MPRQDDILKEGNTMKYKERYSIGDMSRVCNKSKKALRYYDKIGLISSQRQDYNNYRYYRRDSLLTVPVIRYYKQMGLMIFQEQAFDDDTKAAIIEKASLSAS